MKKLIRYTAAIAIIGCVSFNVSAQSYKIGVVNALQLLEQSPQAQAMRAQLQREFEPMDRELVVAQKKLKDTEDQLAKDAAIMSESERQRLERDIITQRRELKRKQDQFREDLTFRQNEEISKIQKDIIEAIRIVAQQNNYDIVLSEGVIHASGKVNMTQQVVDYLNANKAN